MPPSRYEYAAELLARRKSPNSLLTFTEYTHPSWVTSEHHFKLCFYLELLEALAECPYCGEIIAALGVFAPPRHSKALALNTPIPTPDGWTTMGEVEVGDFVLGANGAPTRVTGKSGIQKNRDTYAVVNDSGDVIVADKEHLWEAALCGKHPTYKLHTTETLSGKRKKRARIRQHESLRLPEADLLVDPWVLGAWLGDGCSHHGTMTIAESEKAWFRAQFEARGYTTTDRVTINSFGVLDLWPKLCDLKVARNKHIPGIYLRASHQQRLDLLRGLMDTDGWVVPSGQCWFGSSNPVLAEQALELIRTFGVKANKSKYTAFCNGKNCGPTWKVTFYMTDCALLPRKRNRTREASKGHVNYVSAIPAGKTDVQCIKVSALDGLYLTGRSMMITHNTELVSRRFPSWCFGKHPEWQMICAQATGQLALDTGANVRDIVKSPEFKRIFSGIKLQEDAQAAGRWVTSKGGIYYAAGVDGTIVGRGANVLNIDDPHSGRAAADSQRMRDIAGNWYFGDALPRLMPPERQLITQTRWHEDDLAGRVIPDKKEWVETPDPQFFCAGDWHVLRFRAIEFEDTDRATALWPDRYPLEYLLKRRGTMRKAGRGREWEAQYQQNPVAEQGTFLKRAWFDERYDLIPNGSLFYIVTDFAVTESAAKKDPDRTEIGTICLAPDDKVYIYDWVSLVDTPDNWIEILLDKIDEFSPHAVFGESGTIKNSIEPALMRRMDERRIPAYFEWMHPMGDKLARGQALRAWCASKRVIFPRKSLWGGVMINELVAVGGGGRYWDKFDALSNFFLAIAENNPAILRPQEIQDKPRDIWRVPDHRNDSWR